MRHITLIRSASILFFKGAAQERYEGSLQITIDGTIGIIHSLNCRGLYDVLASEGFAMFRELGLDTIEVSVTPQHVELIRRRLGCRITVREVGPNHANGVSLVRIEMKEAEECQ